MATKKDNPTVSDPTEKPTPEIVEQVATVVATEVEEVVTELDVEAAASPVLDIPKTTNFNSATPPDFSAMTVATGIAIQGGLGSGATGTINKDLIVTGRNAGTNADKFSQIDFKLNANDTSMGILDATETKASVYNFGERMGTATYDTPVIVWGGSWNATTFAPTTTWAGSTVSAVTINEVSGQGNGMYFRPAIGAIDAAMFNSLGINVNSAGDTLILSAYNSTTVLPAAAPTSGRTITFNTGHMTFTGPASGTSTLTLSSSFTITGTTPGSGTMTFSLQGTTNTSVFVISSANTQYNLSYSNASPTFAAGDMYYLSAASFSTMNRLALPTTWGGVLYGGASSPVYTAAGTTVQVLIGGGNNAAPAFGTLNLATMVTGLLPTTNGGTGVNTSGATNGQILVATTGSPATFNPVTPTASGSGLTVTTNATTLQYVLASATAATSATVPLRDGSGRFQAGDPAAAADVATKNYVDSVAVGISVRGSARAASVSTFETNIGSVLKSTSGASTGISTDWYSTGAVTWNSVTYAGYINTTITLGASTPGTVAANAGTNTGVYTAFDSPAGAGGTQLVLGDRVLIKDFLNSVGSNYNSVASTNRAAANGTYVVATNGTTLVFVRSIDDDTLTEVSEGSFLFVEEGATEATTGWIEIGAVAHINPADTSGLTTTNVPTYTQFTGAQSLIFDQGIKTSPTALNHVGTTINQQVTTQVTSKYETMTFGGNGTANFTGASGWDLWPTFIVSTAGGSGAVAATGTFQLNTTGFQISGGATSKTFTISNNLTFTSGTQDLAFSTSGAGGAVTLTITQSGTLSLNSNSLIITGTGNVTVANTSGQFVLTAGTTTARNLTVNGGDITLVGNSTTLTLTNSLTVNGAGGAVTLVNSAGGAAALTLGSTSGTLTLTAFTLSLTGNSLALVSDASGRTVTFNTFNPTFSTATGSPSASTFNLIASGTTQSMLSYNVGASLSASNGNFFYISGSSHVAMTPISGTSTQVLHGGASPAFAAVSLTTDISGILPIANGGTNQNTFGTSNAIVYYDGTSFQTNAALLFTASATVGLVTVPVVATSMTASNAGITLTNTKTAATTAQFSPALEWVGQGWTGSVNNSTRWRAEVHPVNAATPTSELAFAYSLDTGTPSLGNRASFTSTGGVRLYNGANYFELNAGNVSSAQVYLWPPTVPGAPGTNQAYALVSGTTGTLAWTLVNTAGFGGYSTIYRDSTAPTSGVAPGASTTGATLTQHSGMDFVYSGISGGSITTSGIWVSDNSTNAVPVTQITFNDASATCTGFVNITAQSFAGTKTFTSGAVVSAGQTLTLAALTTNGGVLYTNGSGVVSQSANLTFLSNAVTITNSALNSTPTPGLTLTNATAAVVGQSQYAPNVYLSGQGWTGAATTNVDWAMSEVIPNGATTSELGFYNKIGAGSLTKLISFGSDYTVRFYNSGNGNYAAFKAATSTAQITWTLPAADSTGVQYLASNGSGTLSWVSVLGKIYQDSAGPTGGTAPGASTGGASLTVRGAMDFVYAGISGGSSSTTAVWVTDNSANAIPVTQITFLDASNTASGFVNIAAQTFAGTKTFNGGATIASGQNLTIAGLTTNGGVLYTNGSGVVSQSANLTFLSNAVTVTTTSIGNANTVGLTLTNTTAAVVGTSQNAPGAYMSGQGWTGSVTTNVDWQMSSVIPNGVSTSELAFWNKVGAGALTKTASLGSDYTVRFYNSGNANYVAFKAATSTAQVTWVLPAADSTGTQALTSNGSNTLSWQTVPLGSAYQTIYRDSAAPTGGTAPGLSTTGATLTQRTSFDIVYSGISGGSITTSGVWVSDNSANATTTTQITFNDASITSTGFVNIGTQSFIGAKTFTTSVAIQPASGTGATLLAVNYSDSTNRFRVDTTNALGMVLLGLDSTTASSHVPFPIAITMISQTGTTLAARSIVKLGTADTTVAQAVVNDDTAAVGVLLATGTTATGLAVKVARHGRVTVGKITSNTSNTDGTVTAAIAVGDYVVIGDSSGNVGSFGSTRPAHGYVGRALQAAIAGATTVDILINIGENNTVGSLTGSGTAYKLPVWTAAGILGNSNFYQDTVTTPNVMGFSSDGTSSGTQYFTVNNIANSTGTKAIGQSVFKCGGTISTANSYLAATQLITPTATQSAQNVAVWGVTDSAGTTLKAWVDGLGNLRATSKSFDIPHPTKPDQRLVYGVLEGPEHGVYHRGTAKGRGEVYVALPEYWSALAHEDFTVTVTPRGGYGCYVVSKSANGFKVRRSGLIGRWLPVEFEFIAIGSRRDVTLVVEQKVVA